MSTRKEAQSVRASEPTPKTTLSFLEPQSQLKLASFFVLFSSLIIFWQVKRINRAAVAAGNNIFITWKNQDSTYEFTKPMFTDLRVKTLEMTEKKRSPLTWLQPHTLCYVCFSDAFAAWPAGRPSDVVHPTARQLCIHIKTSPGNHNTDAANYPRTAASASASGEPLTVSGMTHLHSDGAAATHVAAMKMQQSQSDHRAWPPFYQFPINSCLVF